MRRAVFLDRDGVLNLAIVRDGRPHPPGGLQDLVLVPDAEKAVSRLSSAGFLTVGVTNQPDVARGLQQRTVVEAINDAVRLALRLDALLTCFHDDRDGCTCRKPRPGLLEQAAHRFEIDLPASFMVGDRWSDVECGTRAGCRTVWIDRGYVEAWQGRAPEHRTTSLAEAADWILEVTGGAHGSRGD